MAKPRKNQTMSLEGADELEAALKKVGDRAGGLVLRKAAEAGAEVLRQEIEDKAPRGAEPSPASAKYGRLSDNIRAVVRRVQHGRTTMEIGPARKAFWALFLEKGTSRMAAQPFIRPAFDAKGEEAAQAVEDALRGALRDVLS
jgi:HK97 gp10 family phage protein